MQTRWFFTCRPLSRGRPRSSSTGGGWRATQAAAALKVQIEAEDRAAWVAKCQAMLANARRATRMAAWLLAGAAACAALTLIAIFLTWGL
ncbi:hypothetical protein [Cypionkella sp.]|uniref:hypothetical protein n=1 Tax=Cypionkella sp. TaxID=2811411 RepID=UPI002ABA15BE|nr:hypothetical protein [Cypionkella sp.]MDZ4393807.1 hypothetical protein [Cypionkella sp.]